MLEKKISRFESDSEYVWLKDGATKCRLMTKWCRPIECYISLRGSKEVESVTKETNTP